MHTTPPLQLQSSYCCQQLMFVASTHSAHALQPLSAVMLSTVAAPILLLLSLHRYCCCCRCTDTAAYCSCCCVRRSCSSSCCSQHSAVLLKVHPVFNAVPRLSTTLETHAPSHPHSLAAASDEVMPQHCGHCQQCCCDLQLLCAVSHCFCAPLPATPLAPHTCPLC
jgi:hypothetical protein